MQSWIGLIVFFLMFVAPVLGKAWQKMQEKAAEKAAIDRAERRQDELLRTGRVSEPVQRTPHPQQQPQRTSRPSLEQLAAQRQAQLRELRRRQQQSARPAGTPTARQPDRLRPQGTRTPSRTIQGQPGARIPTARQQPQQRKVDPRVLAARQRQQLEAQQRERLLLDAEHEAREEKKKARHRSHIAADTAKMDDAFRVPTDSLKRSVRFTASDLRRIVLQSELLAKPLALRASLDDRVF